MNNLELNKELSEKVFQEDFEESDGIEIIEDGDWDDQGKYQYKCIIFSMNDKYYQTVVTRSGSYFSNYDYQFESPEEVIKEEKVVTKTEINWIPVK
mgnify:CR=1 FL=1